MDATLMVLDAGYDVGTWPDLTVLRVRKFLIWVRNACGVIRICGLRHLRPSRVLLVIMPV